MATVFIDGFDKYGITGLNAPALTTTMGQEWNAFNSTPALVAGLSGTGYAVSVGFNWIQKTLPTSYSRLIGGCRFQCTSIGSGVTTVLVQFLNISTGQCTIHINNNGTIYLGSGGTGGANVATSTASVTNNSVHYLEWDITFAASGAYQIWLDGISLFSGTGNVGSGSANVILLGRNTGNNAFNGQVNVDDLYLFDTTGSACNAVLNTNPRIETQYPTSDSQTQWTNAGNVLAATGITTTGIANVTTATNAPGAGQLVLLKVTPAVNCTLQSVGLLPAATSASAKFKAVLYSDSAGAPNTLTSGSTTEVTGCTSGTALTLAFNSPQSLTGGTPYWIGYITDTSVALSQYDNSTNLGQKKANTYASGAPAGPLSGMTTAQPTWEMWGNATGATTNWESVASNPPNGAGPSADNSTITSSTVNNEDLYGFPALTTTPASVYTVAVKGNSKLTGTGTRTITLNTKSSATDSAGSNAGVVPGNSYGWITSHFDRDPNGTIAWTGTSVNAATSGPKVTV